MIHDKYISIQECKRGHVYRLYSRNLSFGLFVPEKNNGFIGIREKFGRTHLFTECHFDNGPPFGTVRPLEDLGPIEDETIPFLEAGPTICNACEGRVEYAKIDGGLRLKDGAIVPGKWVRLNQDIACSDIAPISTENTRLYNYLYEIEKRFLKI